MNPAPASRLHGCIPILVSPFTVDGALDLDAFAPQVEWVLAEGASGVAVNAIASEGYKLTEAERDAAIERVVAVVNGRAPVVASADGPGAEPAADRAARAARLGANALMVLPPYFVKPGADDLVEYYARIGEAAPIPLIVQDAPQLTGVAMTAALWERMAGRIPTLAYIKIEGTPQGHVISETIARCGDRLGVFCGWGGLSILDALERGSAGSMPAANFTREFAAIQQRWEAGDRDSAEEIFAAALPYVLWSMQSIDFSVAATKEEFRRLGILASNRQRVPAFQLDAVSRAQLARFIDRRAEA
ncbi:MAG: dihydrodipicolinate synthase family protein [Chloroflexota bacterium]